MIIRTIESAHAFLLYTWWHGDIKTPAFELCLLLFFIGFFFSSIALSSSSEPLLSSFIALHIAGHIYTRDTPCNTAFYRSPSVYVTLVRTMELAFYRSLSIHATLVHTMGAAFCRSLSVHA